MIYIYSHGQKLSIFYPAGRVYRSKKSDFNSQSTRAVTNPKKNSDPDPNPNEVSCRISDPDPIIHKIYIKHNKTC